jgi:hypothetical protein
MAESGFVGAARAIRGERRTAVGGGALPCIEARHTRMRARLTDLRSWIDVRSEPRLELLPLCRCSYTYPDPRSL